MAADTPTPTDAEVQEVAELFGCSEDTARALIAAAEADGTETADGEILTV
jgi:uncharacterized tellurite resistance protein B-like protein